MSAPMHRNRSVDVHQFAMVPRADIPRSRFRMQTTHKTTFSAAYLIPVFLQEVLPGDSFNLSMTAFSRIATAIYPIMDNLHMESFFFFVPNRLVWTNWVKFQGEQDNPADSISYTIPQIVSPAGGFPRLGIFDYFGLPCTPNLGANTISISSLPLRAYNLIYKEWFRDENLVNSPTINKGDAADPSTDYVLRFRGKRYDYFTGALPWTQKGGVAVGLPLTGSAVVKTQSGANFTGVQQPVGLTVASSGSAVASSRWVGAGPANLEQHSATGTYVPAGGLYFNNLYADLSTATATTINALRLAFQTQRLLERDARGGTRYTEIVRSHFGVISPDARLQRPEYLGGGSSPVVISPIAQQSQTGLTGGATPMGTLAGVGANVSHGHGFSRSFTEHGHIIGLVNVRADLSYQQGIRRLWKRSTRYDFYMPVFAMLGEQSIYNYEIYSDGSANDALTFGYQERWAEYRYFPSLITGYFNSTNATPLDAWHLAQKFSALPTLNQTFIEDSSHTQVKRVVAAGASADNQQFICDMFFDIQAARPMPMYSVPGMVDHF
ncbi:major capsid protein [robinz microvirus RP_41]|nr:major capsid protein [robinz microvirus RP_41]